MAGSLNKTLLIGNLARDPEVRHSQDGAKIVQMTVATNERWKDRSSGEWKEKAEFHRVVIFNDNLSGFAERNLKKGSKVYVEGQLQTRKWTDQSGTEKFSTEIVIGKFKGELTLLDGGGKKDSEQSGQDGKGWDAPADDLDGEEIPF